MFDAGLSFGLSEELESLRATVRRFAAERVAPRAATIDRDNDFPRDLWPALGALGFPTASTPTSPSTRSLGTAARRRNKNICRP
jgi:isovaleryl-CoA dehydrogenase